MNISIFGSGGWGTAISLLLSDNGHRVTLWSKFPEEACALSETRATPLLGGIILPQSVAITSDIADACHGARLAVIATPSHAVRETAREMSAFLAPGTVVVCVSKGIDERDLKLFSQVLSEIFGEERRIVTLSGPSHAEEVARRIPTGCVAASRDENAALLVQDAFMNENFRVYTSSDVIGVELGAALKNVIALCAGTCDGLGFGDNTIAMLATRGLEEIARLAVAMGGRKETIAGLAGLGDLIVTCTSRHSRNRRAGVFIGQGMDTQSAMKAVGATVEGYYAALAAKNLSDKLSVEMPICRAAYSVLYESKPPREAIRELMNRAKRSESDIL
ncbi:MAG: NAD(P)-dependent glycerol-3-phosphate dehydrogenase [Oscillospiraceae bacterium]|jgi:glycerol-3-phosphate dehydrogenase (NAD(P)+)|nr:NAD(P)-dependent glycerol-3-phosphate dehydrogenase [Oscillospiraceae bacterium]